MLKLAEERLNYPGIGREVLGLMKLLCLDCRGDYMNHMKTVDFTSCKKYFNEQ